MSNVIELVKPSFARIDQECAQLEQTDEGNIQRMIKRYGQGIRYMKDTGSWIAWDEKKWDSCDDSEVLYLARKTCQSIYSEAETMQHRSDKDKHERFAKSSGFASRITAMTRLIKSCPEIRITSADLDRHDYLLATKNGYLINLQTGEVRKTEKTDLITKVVNADYDATAESANWINLLNTVFEGDCELINYFQTLCGYSATGLTQEELIVFLHGDGANGKSTIQDTLKTVMGDYSASIESEAILRQKNARHSSEIAVLNGKRFVTTAELGSGRQLNEERIKTLTSGDPIQVRYMCRNPFDMQSKAKLWVSTNNLPVVDYSDNAIWRRIKLIKFNHVFNHETGIDKTMRNKLKSEKEKSGILNWLISGAHKYYTNGLIEPETVTNDTQEWRNDLNIVSRFISDECAIDASKRTLSSELYSAFCSYIKVNGEISSAMSHKAFSSELRKSGYQIKHTKHGNVVVGVILNYRDQGNLGNQGEGLSEGLENIGTLNFSEPSENHSPQSTFVEPEKKKLYENHRVLRVSNGDGGGDEKSATSAPKTIVVFVHSTITLGEAEYRRLAKLYAANLPSHFDSRYIDQAIQTRPIKD